MRGWIMTEVDYQEFLRDTAETVDVMLAGTVRTEAGAIVRVDPQNVRNLLQKSVRRFLAWWRCHHRAENKNAEADLDTDVAVKPNPIDWPTPGGRQAFAGKMQLACCYTTLCAIHESNKTPYMDVKGWPALRETMYRIIRNRFRQNGEGSDIIYDWSAINEALRPVAEHLASEAATRNEGPEAMTAETEPLRQTAGNLRAFAKSSWVGKELSQEDCDRCYHELIACFHPSFEYCLRWLRQHGHAVSSGNVKRLQRDLYEKVRVQYLPSEPNLRVLFPRNLCVEILSLAEEIEKAVAAIGRTPTEAAKAEQLKPRARKANGARSKPRGRPRKHPDAKCKKAWKQFGDLYAKNNDAFGSWNTVADNLDFESGEAARKACERYRQSQVSGQNGHK